ncbi:MAG: hypothetical protein AB4352_11450 [Hormoscilla sp.]
MLQTSLFPTLASAKRSPKERMGVHAWHPYYAGYSEAFVSSAIAYLKLNSTSSPLLLDPWNGSGTTGLVAQGWEIATLGCEINPVMNVFAYAKSGYLLGQKHLLAELSQKITCKSLDISIPTPDPLRDFMSASLSWGIRKLYAIVHSQEYPEPHLSRAILKMIVTDKIQLNPFQAFFKAALFITARNLAGYKGGSNPTWVKTQSEKPEVRETDLISEFKRVARSMIRDLDLSSITITDPILHLPLLADSRNLCLPDDAIDAVITSPPYLTRIDYAMSTRPELLIMFDPQTLRKIRENTIGAPVIVDKSIKINSTWGKTCLQLLENVQKHGSKAATSYYLPNMLQYFRDIELSLREIIRVLKHNARAIIVVQSSYFKEHEIKLGDIYVEMGNNLGVKSEIVNREIIRGHMAHVNTKSNQYKKGKIYFEDMVLLTK